MATRCGSDQPVSLATIVLYNLGGFSFNVYDTTLGVWLVYFYAPPVDSGHPIHLPIGVMGTILFFGRILDAVSDPIVGYLSDHTRSRWGRRRPYIFVSAPILFVLFLLIWLPPVKSVSMANTAYLIAILFFYYWAYTGVLVPWLAVMPELSADSEQRMRIATVGGMLGIAGALVAGGVSGVLYESLGPARMALLLGVVAFATSELALLGVREDPGIATESPSPDGFIDALKQVFTDRQTLSFAFASMCVQMTYMFLMMNTPYMVTTVVGRDEAYASYLMAETLLFMGLSPPLIYFLMRRFSKKSVYRGIIVTMAVGFTLCFFIGATDVVPIAVQSFIVFPVAAIPMGGMFILSVTLIADLSDYDELRYGRRREAIYYGIYGIVRKVGWALCFLILPLTFQLLGYSASNPSGVRAIWLLCVVLCVLALLVFSRYELGDSKEETKRAMSL